MRSGVDMTRVCGDDADLPGKKRRLQIKVGRRWAAAREQRLIDVGGTSRRDKLVDSFRLICQLDLRKRSSCA
jgi:hypothetical protein